MMEKIDLARHIFVGFDNFFIEEKVEKNRKEKSNKPGQQKTWPEPQPEAPANSSKKPIQNSKQQPQKWGERQRRERCCFEFCIGFL